MNWREDDDFYYLWSLRRTWTPFEAACLISSACPPDDGSTDLTKVTIEWDPDAWEDEEKTQQLFYGTEDQIRRYERTISANASGKSEVDPVEITQWAVSKGLIHAHHPLAKLLSSPSDGNDHALTAELENARARIANLEDQVRNLSKKSKETGKHSIEMRARILAAALKELARNREAVVDGGGRVVGAKLADAVNDNRFEHEFERDRPANETIVKHIREALGDKEKKSRH